MTDHDGHGPAITGACREQSTVTPAERFAAELARIAPALTPRQQREIELAAGDLAAACVELHAHDPFAHRRAS